MAATQRTRTATTRGRATQKEKPQTKGRAATAKGRAPKESAETAHRTATVPLVTPHLTLHKVQVPTPNLPVSGDEMMAAGKAVTSFLPPPDRLAYYTGLGALAVFGVIEWPVAAAIGAGVAIAKRAGHSGERRHEQTENRR
ncbi:hypothetical protein [Spirillospora sp. CA-128828]|uniref:hypothetical protein n=1 Tax=Spirillospora sp. CA-128828 TaxID=3240033 RepID=UPI003D93B5D0